MAAPDWDARPLARSPATGVALAALLCVLAGLPAILARYPQMSDYPAHLASWHVMLQHGHNPWLDRYYDSVFQWVPNRGAELVIGPLAAVFGLEPAGRLLVIALPVLHAAAIFTLNRALGRRIGIGAVLALTTIWAPALAMGFVNFALSVVLALFAVALWLAGEGKAWRNPAILLAAPLVWLCHLSGFGILGVMVFSCEWDRRGFWRAIPRTWPLWPPLVLTLLAQSGGAAQFDYGEDLVHFKLGNFITAMATGSPSLDLPITLLLFGAPLVALGRGPLDGRMARAALLFLLLSLVIPRHLGGGDFADYRLVPVALMCGALAIRQLGSRWLIALAALSFLLRLGVLTVIWQRGSAETAEYLAMLDSVPRGARVAAAVADDPLAHLPSMATVRRDALVNSHFAIPGIHMLRLRGLDPDLWSDPSQRIILRPGERPDLGAFPPAAQADWLWYIGRVDPVGLPPGAVVVRRARHSVLARLSPPR